MTAILSLPDRRPNLTLLSGGADLPSDIVVDLHDAFYRAFPRSLKIPSSRSHLYLQYHIGPLDFLVDNDDTQWVPSKVLTGWLELEGARIGMIRLNEWRPNFMTRDKEFFFATDAWSQGTADFGQAVLSAWPIAKLTPHGPLVELARVWMQPAYAKHRLWADAVEALIRHRYQNRFSVFLLNTWPADYKAQEAMQLDWRGEDRWDYRRSSLGRLAQAALNVRPLPRGCPLDDRWWFWRPLSKGVPLPRRRRLTWL